MNKKVIKINDDVFFVDVVKTSKGLHKGLSGTKDLPKDEGMLFDFSKPKEIYMVMRDMNYSLDFVFIKDNIIKTLKTADKDSKESVTSDGKITHVLEINQGNISKYKVGDKVEISEKKVEDDKPKKEQYKGKYSFDETGNIVAVHDGFEIVNNTFFTNTILNKIEKEIALSELTEAEYISKIKETPSISIVGNAYKAYSMINSFRGGGDLTYNENEALKIGDVIHKPKVKDIPILKGHMQVLDNDGYVIYNIKGGERIFSIIDTKEIINNVLAVEEGGSVEDLGKLVVNMLNKHDKNKPQFVGK